MAIFYADSGSFKSITVTGSINISNGGTLQGTASYATTASYALNGGGGAAFPYTGSARVTGSLSVNGTTTVNGPWNGNFTNGIHLSFASNIGSIYSLQNGSAWRRLDIEADPLVLNVQSAANVGIGTATPVGKLQVNLDNTDYTNTGGAGSHIVLTNPNASGQNVLSSYINSNLVAKWRTDYQGNINWIANEGYHAFWTGGDYPVGNAKMVIFNNGNVSIGTAASDAGIKFKVTDGTGSMGFPYEIAAFERNGDNKLGIFSSANAFYGNGVSIVLGYTNVLDENSKYPGFEFQYIGDNVTANNVVRYNFIERQSDGQVVAAVPDLLNIYADGKVTVNGGTPKLGIGTSSPSTTLHVFNPSDTIVAHFESTNGYPIQIRTTDEPLSSGYDSPIGSIGNGAGILYVKTGSLDPDWAPIVYEKGPMPQSTHTAIDLSVGNYTIPGAGIYEITNASSNSLIFPDPVVFDGQRITIINTDNSNTAAIDNTNTFAPYNTGKTTQFSNINTEGMGEMVSINGKWRGFIA